MRAGAVGLDSLTWVSSLSVGSLPVPCHLQFLEQSYKYPQEENWYQTVMFGVLE